MRSGGRLGLAACTSTGACEGSIAEGWLRSSESWGLTCSTGSGSSLGCRAPGLAPEACTAPAGRDPLAGSGEVLELPERPSIS